MSKPMTLSTCPVSIFLTPNALYFFLNPHPQTTKKLESVGLLQAFTTDDPPVRLRSDAEDVFQRVFAVFVLYTLTIYWVIYSYFMCLYCYGVIVLCQYSLSCFKI